MTEGLKIGELARRTDCKVVTIRYYEREGLLPTPARSRGNYRRYNDGHVERLSFIRHCRSLDMTLDEIRILLRFRDTPEEICSDVNVLLDRHIAQVDARITHLMILNNQLRELRHLCSEGRAARDCGILKGLAHPVVSSPHGVPSSHLESVYGQRKR